ncbi:conserved hypothetical protein [Echinococcus multilocularis]|uniref:Uncharacterized protein n=1 Tax=Echinococcus multilocularis TaxID=6211 RepID=A0A068YKM4_ECHMU|nr:conserved hypothetical protein [Echinococcus multilocularis]
MTDISEKLSEIERNIQEGETMLTVLRRLPESEETNGQIKRFQELVRQLEEYKERYKALQASPLNDFEAQLEALRDKHERIKMLLGRSALGGTKPSSPPPKSHLSHDDHECTSPVLYSKDGSVSSRATNTDAPENSEQLACSYNIEPSEWRLHYENQTRQLSSMLSQIARFQEMVGRLSNLVIGLDMTEAVNLLSDVGQRFTEVHLRLLSLQTAYETVCNGEDPSNDFKATQLKDLRAFLISLGRSLEVTKECFFTVASIVRKTLLESSASDASSDQTANGLSQPVPPALNSEPGEPETVSAAAPTAGALPNEEELDYSKEQKRMELTIAQLYKQREALLSQLAEARAKANGSTSPPKDGCGNTSELISSAPFSSVDRTSNKHASTSLSSADAAASDPLPILKRLQARKEHLEELRGELRSFTFPNGDEAPPQAVTSTASEINRQLTSLSSNVLQAPGVSIKVPPPRPRTSPHVTVKTSATGIATSNLASAEVSLPTSFLASEPPTPRHSTQDISSVASNDSDVVTQKCEVVTFQEPEATYLDNTERLYKSMREARIWREEHRKAPTDLPVGDKEGDMTSTNGRLRNGGLSESTSCIDATAMATWGGDSDREGNDIEDVMVVGGEYIEDVPSVVSSRSSRANRRFITTSACSVNDGDGSSSRGCLGVHTDPQEPSVGISLPHLGHSPSPRTGGSGTVTTTRPPQRRQSSRPSQLSHRGMAESSFEEYALTKSLAAKIANLEFKVEQLTQTSQLLVTENARLSSALSVLLASQRLPPIAGAANSDWPASSHSGAAFANLQQPLLSISTGGLFSSPVPPFRPSDGASGLPSVHPLAPAPLTPTLHAQPSPSLEKALDQVQMLTAQVIEQHSRMNQLQNDLHVALQQQQHHFAGGGDVVSVNHHLASASGMRSYQTPTQPSSGQGTRRESYQPQVAGLSSLMALQATTDLQSRQPSAGRPPAKLDCLPIRQRSSNHHILLRSQWNPNPSQMPSFTTYHPTPALSQLASTPYLVFAPLVPTHAFSNSMKRTLATITELRHIPCLSTLSPEIRLYHLANVFSRFSIN